AGQNDSCGSEYTITRKWTATESAANSISHTQIITVEDTTAPVFAGTLPTNTTVSCNNIPNAPTITATDTCDNNVTVAYTQTTAGQNDSCGSEYTITRKWTATESAANSISHTQIITVEDTTAPVFAGTLPTNTTVSCNNIPNAPTITATDTCDNNVTVAYTQTTAGQNDSCGSEYTITRKWTATDCAGNSRSHTQIITVEDTTAPVFAGTLPTNTTVSCNNIPNAPTITATDTCDNNVTVAYTQTTAGQNDSCGSEYTITRKWTATDCAGNSRSHTQIITVEDTTAPVFAGTLPTNTTVSCNNIPNAPTITATDTCDNNVTVAYTQTTAGQNDSCGSEYTITRKWTATDCAGNSRSHTQIITVEDTTAPVFAGTLPTNTTVSCNNIPNAPTITATDTCDNNVTVAYTQTTAGQNDSCGSEYTITRKWTATDCAGNSRSHTQIITVEDTTAPVFAGTLPTNTTVSCNNIPNAPTITATDTCDNNVTVAYTQTTAGQNDSCGSEYTITRKWTATDCAGNSRSHTQIITVEDTTARVGEETVPTKTTDSFNNIP